MPPDSNIPPVSLREYLESRIGQMETRLGGRLDDLKIDVTHRFRQSADNVITAMAASEKAIGTAMVSAEKAAGKSEAMSEKRYADLTELRQASDHLIALSMPRAEIESRFNALSEKIDSLVNRLNRSEGAGVGMRTSWTVLIAAIAGIGGLISIFVYLSSKNGG